MHAHVSDARAHQRRLSCFPCCPFFLCFVHCVLSAFVNSCGYHHRYYNTPAANPDEYYICLVKARLVIVAALFDRFLYCDGKKISDKLAPRCFLPSQPFFSFGRKLNRGKKTSLPFFYSDYLSIVDEFTKK